LIILAEKIRKALLKINSLQKKEKIYLNK